MYMAEMKNAWEEVGSLATGLGLKLKLHLAQARSDSAAGSAATEPSETDAARSKAVTEALQKLGEAIDTAVDAVASAAKDPAISADVREVGRSLTHAMGTTFSEVSDDVRKAFARRGAKGDDVPPTAAP
jgi:hypothetical protein